MADVVLKVSGKMREIEIDPVSELDAELDEDLVEANEEDFADVDDLDDKLIENGFAPLDTVGKDM